MTYQTKIRIIQKITGTLLIITPQEIPHKSKPAPQFSYFFVFFTQTLIYVASFPNFPGTYNKMYQINKYFNRFSLVILVFIKKIVVETVHPPPGYPWKSPYYGPLFSNCTATHQDCRSSSLHKTNITHNIT